LIDDDQLFLDSLSYALEKKYSTISFTEPTQAIEHINSASYKPITKTKPFILLEDDEALDPDYITIKKQPLSLHHEIYNPQRFSTPSIAIIDYTMPQMHGEQVCAAINNKFIKKILLTGNKDFDNAINLFNNGLIDRYIVKDPSELIDELSKAIIDLQNDFFSDLSKNQLSNNFFNSQENEFAKPAIQNLINQIILDKKICEYYIVEPNKSMLMLNKYGETSWFYLINKNEINTHLDIAKGNDAPDSIQTVLENRSHFPLLTTPEALNIPVDKWSNHLYPILPLPNANDLYYTLADDAELYSIKKEKIIAYETKTTASMV
jgi:CheY-like chemotaxis protein